MGSVTQSAFAISPKKIERVNGDKTPERSVGKNDNVTLINNPTCKKEKIIT